MKWKEENGKEEEGAVEGLERHPMKDSRRRVESDRNDYLRDELKDKEDERGLGRCRGEPYKPRRVSGER